MCVTTCVWCWLLGVGVVAQVLSFVWVVEGVEVARASPLCPVFLLFCRLPAPSSLLAIHLVLKSVWPAFLRWPLECLGWLQCQLAELVEVQGEMEVLVWLCLLLWVVLVPVMG